jgi:hypothetical protein
MAAVVLKLAIYEPKGRIEADLIEVVCDPTPTSRRAIRPWHRSLIPKCTGTTIANVSR